MNYRHPFVLISCVLLAGCVPASPPRPPARGVSVPVALQRPQAPQLKQVKRGYYRVRKPWTVDLNGRRWLVPAGFTTNGITAPDSMRKSLGDGIDRPETWAAIFHDWLFKQPGISRAEADKMFHDLLIAYGVPASKARIMYLTVSAYSLTKANNR